MPAAYKLQACRRFWQATLATTYAVRYGDTFVAPRFSVSHYHVHRPTRRSRIRCEAHGGAPSCCRNSRPAQRTADAPTGGTQLEQHAHARPYRRLITRSNVRRSLRPDHGGRGTLHSVGLAHLHPFKACRLRCVGCAWPSQGNHGALLPTRRHGFRHVAACAQGLDPDTTLAMLLLHERAKGAASHWADYLQAKHNSATIRVNSDGAIFPAHVQTPALETRSKVGHKHPRSEADGDSTVEGAARLRKKRRKSTKAGKGKCRSKVPSVASPATWSYVYPQPGA